MRRRALLGAGLLAALPSPRAHAAPPILIIGAGAAGIAAAGYLRDRGEHVIVLEARRRIGGRILTDTTLGHPLDLGAAWVHGTDGNPIVAALGIDKVRTAPSDFSARQVYGVKRLSRSALRAAEQTLEDRLVNLDPDHETLDGAIGALDPLTRMLAASDIELEFGADLSELSTIAFNEDEEYDGDHVLLADGYGPLLAAKARGLDVRLGHIVSAIEHDDRGVVVTSNRGRITARAAVLTVPVSVLQSRKIQFSPAPPKRWQSALSNLWMGNLEKLALRFREPFWPSSAHILSFVGAGAIEAFPMTALGYANTLVLLSAGRLSRQVAAMPDADAQRWALKLLAPVGANALPPVAATVRSRWQTDPHSGGSYSLVRPGSDLSSHRWLAAPIGPRLFVAGEASDASFPGTVHGAWRSGIRAARECLNAL
jgi:monoamine oxidase